MSLGRLGRMGFINALPVEWDLEQGKIKSGLEVVSGPPTQLNALLAAGELDVSAVSSISVLENSREWLALPGPCIASKGKVGSVFLVSERPVRELEGLCVAVDPASATSVKLLQILFDRLWRVKTRLVGHNQPAAARLIIGDKALKLAQHCPPGWLYDLGAAWQKLTGKGFVFGLWAVRQSFTQENPEAARAIKELLEKSCESAVKEHQKVIRAGAERLGLAEAVISDYYKCLVHRLDGELKAGLDLFGQMAGLETARLKWFESKRPENATGPENGDGRAF